MASIALENLIAVPSPLIPLKDTMESKPAFEWVAIITPVIAGIFALVGSYFGAKLLAKEQRKNILLEHRRNTFNTFLAQLDHCEHERASNENIDPYMIYQPLRLLMNSTQLLLNKEDRFRFDELVRKFIVASGYYIKYRFRDVELPGPPDIDKALNSANEAKEEIKSMLMKYFDS